LGSVIVGAAWVAPAIVAVSSATPAAASGTGGGSTGVGSLGGVGSPDAVFPQQPGSSTTTTEAGNPGSPIVAPSTATTRPEPPPSVASGPGTETSPSSPSLLGVQAPGFLANTGVDVIGAVAIGSALTAAGVVVTRAARQPQRQAPTAPEPPAD